MCLGATPRHVQSLCKIRHGKNSAKKCVFHQIVQSTIVEGERTTLPLSFSSFSRLLFCMWPPVIATTTIEEKKKKQRQTKAMLLMRGYCTEMVANFFVVEERTKPESAFSLASFTPLPDFLISMQFFLHNLLFLNSKIWLKEERTKEMKKKGTRTHKKRKNPYRHVTY